MAIDPNNPLLNGPRRIDARPVVRLEPFAVAESEAGGPTPISEVEILAARTPRGAWTRATLAGWGVSWPPPKGWKERLLRGEAQEPGRGQAAVVVSAPELPLEPRVYPEARMPGPGEPGFDSTKHGLLSPPRVTYRKLY